MIIFLDIIKKEVKVYTEKGLSTIPFSNFQELEKIIGNNKVLYVKDRAWVDKNQILSLLGKKTTQTPSNQRVKDSSLWVHCVGKGTLHISDFGVKQNVRGKDGGIGFDFLGPGHFVELKVLKQLGCDNSTQFQTMLNSQGKNRLEIVNGDFKAKFLKTYKSDTQTRKDKRSDSILIEGSASDYASKINSGKLSKSTAVEIEINDGNVRSMGSDDNEGMFLPDDV